MLALNQQSKKLLIVLGVCFLCSSLLNLQTEKKMVSKLDELRSWVIAYLNIGLQNQKYQKEWSHSEKRLAHLSVSHWRDVKATDVLSNHWSFEQIDKTGFIVDAQVQSEYVEHWLTHNHYAKKLRKKIKNLAVKRKEKQRKNRRRKTQRESTEIGIQPLYTPPFISVLHQKIYQEMRLYPPQHPAQIIAIRKVYEQQFKSLQVTAYWVAPCSSLCGVHASCAQQCQNLMSSWSDPLPKGSMVVDVSLKNSSYSDQNTMSPKFLGRVALSNMGALQTIFWSKNQKLLALAQQSQFDHTYSVYLFRVTDKGLLAIAHLPLGTLVKNPNQIREIVRFRDLDDDGQVEMIAPDSRFTFLLPQAIHVKMVYKITNQGLKIQPQLVDSMIPQSTDLRIWLLQSMKANRPLNEFFAELLTFCLQNRCAVANEIVHLAYPQDENIQSYWDQLKSYL